MRVNARHRTAATLIALLTLPSPLRAQAEGSVLGALDGAVGAERAYCAGLEYLDAGAAQAAHDLARPLAEWTAGADEQEAFETFEKARLYADKLAKSIQQVKRERDLRDAAAVAKVDAANAVNAKKRAEIRASASAIDGQLAAADDEIARLDAENQGYVSSKLLGTAGQIKANTDRIAALKAERPALMQRKRDLASDFALYGAPPSDLMDEVGEALKRSAAAEAARLKGLEPEERKAKADLAEKRAAHARAVEAATRAKLIVQSMDACLARRLAQIAAAGKAQPPAPKAEDPPPTPPTATPPVTAASSPPTGGPAPPLPPGAAAGTLAEVAGTEWPGMLKSTCLVNDKITHGTGELRARFTAPNRFVIEIGPRGQKQISPLEAEVDNAGRFTKRQSEAKGVIQFEMDGRFQFERGGDGRVRPAGAGNFQYSIGWWVLGGFGGQGVMTPEQREFATERCRGTWQLPAES